MLKRFVVTTAALIVLVGTAAPARADWLLTPYLGVTFGGETDSQHVTYGASASWMGAGVIGFEIDGAFAPDVLNTGTGVGSDLVDTNVTTLMANLILGVPIGAPGVRPYVSGGAGLLRTSVSSADDFFNIDDNSFGVNVGAGVMVFVRENFGLRGDLRYFRSLRDDDPGDGINVGLGSFDFWRGTIGATFRF
jgi:opacity protein-like surface antigen